ncbi:MAG: hypothetical protein VYD57_01210 [Pseudomonadota bacterium]|nr:hypothetical protein [Pseudomonadota bacterium]
MEEFVCSQIVLFGIQLKLVRLAVVSATSRNMKAGSDRGGARDKGMAALKRKPFPWHKLTPAQIALLEKIFAAADGVLDYSKLNYAELTAFEELRKLKLADTRPRGRSKLDAVVTDQARKLRGNAYKSDRVVVRVTEPQIELLRYLDDGFS